MLTHNLIERLQSFKGDNVLLKGNIENGSYFYISSLGNWNGKHLELSVSDELPIPKPKYKNALVNELLNYNENSSFSNGKNKVFLSKIIEHADGSYDRHYHEIVDVYEDSNCLIIKASTLDVKEMRESYPPFDEDEYDYSEDE